MAAFRFLRSCGSQCKRCLCSESVVLSTDTPASVDRSNTELVSSDSVKAAAGSGCSSPCCCISTQHDKLPASATWTNNTCEHTSNRADYTGQTSTGSFRINPSLLLNRENSIFLKCWRSELIQTTRWKFSGGDVAVVWPWSDHEVVKRFSITKFIFCINPTSNVKTPSGFCQENQGDGNFWGGSCLHL